MEVYYREGDEVWVGDLSYIKLSEEARHITDFDRKNWPEKYTAEMTHKPYSSFITFDTSWRKTYPRKRLHLEDPSIEGFGVNGIEVKDKYGTEYMFYIEKPLWIETSIAIAPQFRSDYVPPSESKTDEAFDDLSWWLSSDDTIKFGGNFAK